MAFIGNTPTTQAFTPQVDYFSGNGSTTAFTLSRPVASVAQVQAVIENVPQAPTSAFTVSGNTITFTSAPPSGTNNIYVYYTSPITQVIAPGQGTVGTTQLVDGSITTAKLASSFVAPEANGGTGTTTGYYGFKNRIINGAMQIDQRNAGASVTNTGLKIYSLDRWFIQGVSSSKFTAQQNAPSLGSVAPPAGFTNYLGITSSAATAVGSSDYYFIGQSLEGFNTADLGWGTANASTVTLSFWVRSSLTGAFGGALRNSATNRAYPFTYTINAANTWEYETITIAGDTSGTWLNTNGVGIDLDFGLGVGSAFSGTAGSWSANNYVSATGATSVVGTNGATFYITGVQLEKGSTATSFDYRPYGTELSLCQRYYEVLTSTPTGGSYYSIVSTYFSASNYWAFWQFKQTKRSAPTVALASGVSWAGSTPTIAPTIDLCLFSSASTFYNPGAAGTTSITASAEL